VQKCAAKVRCAGLSDFRCTCANVRFHETTPPFATSRRPAYAGPMLIDRIIASDAVLNQAYKWLCHRRKDYGANADVWNFRRNWQSEKARLRADLIAGCYRFDVLDRVTLKDGSIISLWSSRDALVLKAMTLCLEAVLPVSTTCTHIRGHGGAKEAIRQVHASLPKNTHVFRTDVKSYYASIDHFLLLDRLAEHVADRAAINLLSQYMRRTICDGGNFVDIERGISLGCPLSPLMATFFLNELDQAFEQSEVFYIRFMDDILILAPTRWKLCRSVATLNGVLSELRLEKHPDKTYIGRIARGFDYLGYHFVDGALRAAHKTTRKMYETAVRLYEQKGHRDNPTPLGQYLTRWNAWFRGGLSGIELRGAFLPALEGGDAPESGEKKQPASR
jgi:RNA-directed DNA polymerase